MGTLTNTINRLEEKGYLFRINTKIDLRSYELSLTEKGIQAQKAHKEYERQVFGGILETLEAEKRTELLTLIKKIIKNLAY
ncbi:MAG: MarR family winged helix-turn-helix transcriptional regulator [Lachnotalea sp.]